MRVEKVGPSGIFRKEKIKRVKNETIRTMEGVVNNNNITVYSQYTNDILMSKLYYLSDKFDNFLKLKLVSFDSGQKKVLLKQSKSF